jgi:NhaA family Na+:H+ antiporter
VPLAGIGFTKSIFIALLAFDDPAIINNTKLVILLSSLAAALLGITVLGLGLGKQVV